jgi:hypothetical protein
LRAKHQFGHYWLCGHRYVGGPTIPTNSYFLKKFLLFPYFLQISAIKFLINPYFLVFPMNCAGNGVVNEALDMDSAARSPLLHRLAGINMNEVHHFPNDRNLRVNKLVLISLGEFSIFTAPGSTFEVPVLLKYRWVGSKIRQPQKSDTFYLEKSLNLFTKSFLAMLIFKGNMLSSKIRVFLFGSTSLLGSN